MDISERYIKSPQSQSKITYHPQLTFFSSTSNSKVPSDSQTSSSNHTISNIITFTMVHFTTLLTAALAGITFASPSERRQAASSSDDLVCGALLQPLAGFLDYQSGNAAGNTENVLAAASNILSDANLPSDVESIINSVTGGIVGSITNGVSNVLYGLSTGADNVDPECKQNAAYCTNELRAASAACSAGQSAQAQDACLQAKYTCARNDILSADQVDGVAPCCSQYTGSAASSS
jgi:hypothetical protein